jgi:hypothetical protein
MAIYNPGHLAGRQMLGLTSETKQDLVIARLMQVKRKRYIFRLDNVDSIVSSSCRYHHSDDIQCSSRPRTSATRIEIRDAQYIACSLRERAVESLRVHPHDQGIGKYNSAHVLCEGLIPPSSGNILTSQLNPSSTPSICRLPIRRPRLHTSRFPTFITTPLTTYTSCIQNVYPATSDPSEHVHANTLPLSEQ